MIPLTRYDGPPEVLLQQCHDRIVQNAPPDKALPLLVVSTIFASMATADRTLWDIILEKATMIDAPLLRAVRKEGRLENARSYILDVLAARFGVVTEDVRAGINVIADESRLREFALYLVTCPDYASFREHILRPQN